jgi:hypothetical protein
MKGATGPTDAFPSDPVETFVGPDGDVVYRGALRATSRGRYAVSLGRRLVQNRYDVEPVRRDREAARRLAQIARRLSR